MPRSRRPGSSWASNSSVTRCRRTKPLAMAESMLTGPCLGPIPHGASPGSQPPMLPRWAVANADRGRIHKHQEWAGCPQGGCDFVGRRALGVAMIAALLATAGLAAAQQASFSVSLSPTSELQPVQAGGSTSVDVDVNLQGDGFSCADDVTLPVNMSVSPTGGVSGTANPAPVEFSNTMGIHNSDGPTGGYNETETTTVTFQVSGSASGGDKDVTLTGLFPGGNYGPGSGNCAPSEFPEAEGTTTVTVPVQASSDSGTDTGGDTGGDDGVGGDDGDATDGNDTIGNESDEDDNGIPVGPWVAPAALVAGALALRRRD